MKYILLLSGDYIDLAKEEIISLFDSIDYKLVNNLSIIDLKNDTKSINKLSQRLALTKSIYKLLFECKVNELIKIMQNYEWNSIYKDNFCLRIHYLNKNKKNPTKNKNIKKYQEKDLAKYIWHSVANPKVNLSNPKTKIELFFIGNSAYCGLLVKEIHENFEARKSHKRPFPSASSLHPKLARALVNITGVKENEILLDPF